MNRIIIEGEWIENSRTGKKCKTLINADMEYDFCPLVTTRKSYWKSAVAEFVGYLRGYTSAADFRALGTKTWDANANENEAWLNNSYREGEDDMGRVYGAQGREWRMPNFYMSGLADCASAGDSSYSVEDQKTWNELCVDNKNNFGIDQLKNVYEDLKNGVDNRGEIISFWNPGEFSMGCLRPCIHTHTFSLVNGTLHLTSYQRSADWPLGVNFNLIQCYFFLQLMAQITGNKAGTVYHKIVNAHIYEDQYELAKVEAARDWNFGEGHPIMTINKRIKTLEDVETIFTLDDVSVENYYHHDAINYPFSV